MGEVDGLRDPERTPPEAQHDQPVRLQKLLARAGVASRRAVEEMIGAGRVRVNGRTAVLGQRAVAGVDRIEVDGALVGLAPDTVWYLLHKPAGIVTTADDPHGRPTVVELVPDEPRVFPVGRLDADTEGLLLLTNDGEVAHRLTHPRYGVDKEYLVHVRGAVSRGALRRLREGVDLDDGPTAPAQASAVSPSLLRLTIHEGRNRQVRRMCDAVGHPVERLVRVRIGPITDTQLAAGEHRPLRAAEVRRLEAAAVDRSPTQRPDP